MPVGFRSRVIDVFILNFSYYNIELHGNVLKSKFWQIVLTTMHLNLEEPKQRILFCVEQHLSFGWILKKDSRNQMAPFRSYFQMSLRDMERKQFHI